MIKRLILSLSLLCGGVIMTTGNEVVFFERDGADIRHASIVLAEEPVKAARFAAEELRYHIELITRFELPIVHEPADTDGPRILVGASDATDEIGLPDRPFDAQEYLIEFLPDTIVLMGKDAEDRGELDYARGRGMPGLNDDIGTLYATYDFLERFCGVRWYLPTDLGIVFDRSDRLAAGGESIRRAPAMRFRRVSMGYSFPLDLAGDTIAGDEPIPPLPRHEHLLFYLRSRIGGELHTANHSFYGWYHRFWDEDSPHFEEKRPEYFARGYEDAARPPQLCYTSPDAVEQVVRDAREFFDTDARPSRTGAGNHAAVVPMDNNSWCKCDECQNLLLEEATLGRNMFSNNSASDYFFQFANMVARGLRETHPGKQVSTLGYWDYCYPPANIELEPNVNVTLCLHTRGWGFSPKTKDNDLLLLNAWAERPEKPDLYLWLYYCFPSLGAVQGGYRMFPGFFAPDIVGQMAIFHEAGIVGMRYEPSYIANMRQSPLLDQLEFYVTWRLADNPELDGHALIDEFFTRYYGPAAEPMRAFYMKAARIYGDPENNPENVRDPVLSWRYRGTQERMEALGTLMAEAVAIAGEMGTETERERVALFNRGIWEFMKKGYDTYQEQMLIPFPEVAAPRIEPVPEGDPLSIEDWSEGGAMTGWLNLDGSETDKRIEGRIMHDGKNLYIRLVDEMDPADLVDRAGSIWRSDNYEIFMAAQRARPYHQIGLHFNGRFAALTTTAQGRETWEFGGGIVSDVSSDDRWTVYLSVPLEEIGVQPDGVMYMNVIRSLRIRPQVAVLWNPTFGPYHEPARMAEVTLLE